MHTVVLSGTECTVSEWELVILTEQIQKQVVSLKSSECIFELVLNVWVWWPRGACEKSIQEFCVLREFSVSVGPWLSEQSSLTDFRIQSAKLVTYSQGWGYSSWSIGPSCGSCRSDSPLWQGIFLPFSFQCRLSNMCLYTPRVQSHTLTLVRMLKNLLSVSEFSGLWKH